MFSKIIAISLSLFISFSPALAAGYGGGSGKLKDSTTNRLVRLLERSIKLCQSLDTVYRYDCYRQKYGSAAGQLAGNTAYAVPLGALLDVQVALDRIVAQNTDPAVSTIRKKGDTFRAITPSSTAQAKETFRQALDEAATELLRSGDRSGTHFARIAQALDSNKILLRALLRMIGHSPPDYMLG